MKLVTCDYCQQADKPLNDTLQIEEKTVCSKCLEIHFTDQRALEQMRIERHQDPTVCFSCGTDNGEADLPKLSTYPVCADCEQTIRNRTFPLWVKAFFAAVLVIVVFAFFWNWRFYQSYSSIKKANAHFENGEFREAATLSQEASERVPEVKEIASVHRYFNGLALLKEDKSNEALVELTSCKGDPLVDGPALDGFILQAKIASAYDSKNYDLFVTAAKEQLALDSTLAVSWAQVASAYACVYAQKGTEPDKNFALTYLTKARSIDNTDEDIRNYYNAIEYRIETKDIITRDVFNQRFPQGWHKN